jgi:hypothetical protein
MTAEFSAIATRLCAACGMCCDGTLFHSVVLQSEDSARALAARGLRIKRRRDEAWFHQPCAAHQEMSCTIYGERPTRCRRFVCRQLQGVAAGDIPESAAREKIAVARALAARAIRMADGITETNPRRALAQRCANALAGAPEGPAAELRAALQELEDLLARDFRVETP